MTGKFQMARELPHPTYEEYCDALKAVGWKPQEQHIFEIGGISYSFCVSQYIECVRRKRIHDQSLDYR